MKFLSVFIITLVLTAPGIAQTGAFFCTVRGHIADERGGNISETSVTFEDSNRKEFVTRSNENGDYQIQLPQGTYSVKAEYLKHGGWEQFSVIDFGVKSGSISTLNIVLRVSKGWTEEYGSSVVGGRGGDANSYKIKDKYFIIFTGTVYDPTGAVVSSVNIKVTDEQGRSNAVKTNDEGAFLIGLAPGLYSIIIEKAGFKTLEYKKYRIVNSTFGKMNIDFVICGSTDHEPCGYGGGECRSAKPIGNIEKTKP